jgi:hypothetical protein
MVQKDSAGYSQMKGKNMYGKFKDNELNTLDVVGNSEVIFYGRDENQKLIGISKMQASKNIFITLENNEISTIKFFTMATGNTYPPSKLPDTERLLKGFAWRENERPLTKEDIFIHDNVIPKTTPKMNPAISPEETGEVIEVDKTTKTVEATEFNEPVEANEGQNVNEVEEVKEVKEVKENN